jgi:hypothetical protein
MALASFGGYRMERTSGEREFHPLESSAFHGALFRQRLATTFEMTDHSSRRDGFRHLDCTHCSAAKTNLYNIVRGEGFASYRFIMFVDVDEPIAAPDSRCAQSFQYFLLGCAEPKADGQHDSTRFALKYPTSLVEFCIRGETFPTKAAHSASVNLAVLQPQHPAPLRVLSMKAQPLTVFTSVAFMPNYAAEACSHIVYFRLFKLDREI